MGLGFWDRALLGAAGGIVGMGAMTVVMQAGSKAQKRAHKIRVRVRERRGLEGEPPSKNGAHKPRSMSLVGVQHRPDESATAALGRNLYSAVTRGKEPSGKMKHRLSQGVHWVYGLTVAGLYGAARTRARRDRPDISGGLIFGLGLWAVGDELLVPLLGLSDAPTEFPASFHAQALAGHLAFGAATAAAAHLLAKLAVNEVVPRAVGTRAPNGYTLSGRRARRSPHVERWMVSGPVAWRSRTKKLTGMRAVPRAR